MIAYLLITSLLIPVNIWAAITPHLHTVLTMRVLHAASVTVLVPLLASLWFDRKVIQPAPALVLATFLMVMVVVNTSIAIHGMGVEYGWIDHLLLALAALSVEIYYLLEPQASAPFQDRSRSQSRPG